MANMYIFQRIEMGITFEEMTSPSEVWLQVLRVSNSKLLRYIFSLGPVDAILTLCELALNYKEGTYRPKLSGQQKEYALKFADRLISVKRKRKFLLKPQGIKFATALLQKL